MPIPTVPPAPNFADFKFNIIGRQPELLKRISAPDPDVPYQYQPSPSPTPTPGLESGLLQQTESNLKSLPLSRPTLLEALADNTNAGDKAMADEMLVDDGMNQSPLVNLPTSDAPSASVGSTRYKSREPHSRTPPSITPFIEQKTVGLGCGAVSPVQPLPFSLPPTNSPTHISPHIQASRNATSPDLNSARPTLSPRRSLSYAHDSIQLQYPPSEVSEYPETTRSSLPYQVPLIITQPQPQPEVESPYTTLRSLQARLLSSLSTLATPHTISPVQAQALHLVQSAHTRSAAALAMAHRAHTLAQQSLVAAQDSLTAARECLDAAEEAKTQAGEAMNTVEKIGGEGEVTQWEWKEIVEGFRADLEALEVWVGEREGEEAVMRRVKERKDEEEQNRDVTERAMSSKMMEEGEGLSNGIVRAMSAEVGKRSEESRVRKKSVETIEEGESEDAEGDIRMREDQEDREDGEKRAAEIEADLARRAWDSERERSALAEERRRAAVLVEEQSREQRTRQQANEQLIRQNDDEITAKGNRTEQDPLRLANEKADATAIAHAEEARSREESQQEEEEHARMQKETEVRLQEQRQLELAKSQMEQRQQEQLAKEQEEQRLRVLRAEEHEKEARLIKEQDAKRQQVMAQKQRASAEAAVKIIAEREAKERQLNGNLATTSTATPATPAANLIGSSTIHAQVTQRSPPAAQVGNVVARKTVLPVPSPEGTAMQAAAKEKGRVLSGGTKLGITEKPTILRPPSPLCRAVALGIRARKPTLENDTSTSTPTTSPPHVSRIVTARAPATSGGGNGPAPVVTETHRIAATDRPVRSNPPSQVTGGNLGSRKQMGGKTADILATVRQHQSQTPAKPPVSFEGSYDLDHDRGLQGVVNEDPIARRPNIPPIAHMTTQASPSLSSAPPASFTAASVYRQSRDAGNLPIAPISSPPVLSPEANAMNLRHVMKANRFDWEKRGKAEPESPVHVKPELGDDDNRLLSRPPPKSPPPSKSQKPPVRHPAASSNTLPSRTAPSSSMSHAVASNIAIPTISHFLPVPPGKPKLPDFKKNKDAETGIVSEGGQPHAESTTLITPNTGVVASSPSIDSRTNLSTKLNSSAHIEWHPPAPDPDDIVNSAATDTYEASYGALGMPPHDPAAEVFADRGWGPPNDEVLMDRVDASVGAPYEPSTGGERRRRPVGNRQSAPSFKAYDHYSPGPDSSQRRIYRCSTPEGDIPRRGEYHPTPSIAVPTRMPTRSPSPPRYLPGKKRGRESNYAELPPPRRSWLAGIEHQPDREHDRWVPGRSPSPQPAPMEGRRRPARLSPSERPALETRIERSRSPDVFRLGRGESYRPSYNYPTRSQGQTSTTPPYHEYAHSSTIPATATQWDGSRQDGRQSVAEERPELLDRLSSVRQPAGYPVHGSSHTTGRPSRGPGKPRGGGRGASRGALSQRISGSHSLQDRLA